VRSCLWHDSRAISAIASPNAIGAIRLRNRSCFVTGDGLARPARPRRAENWLAAPPRRMLSECVAAVPSPSCWP